MHFPICIFINLWTVRIKEIIFIVDKLQMKTFCSLCPLISIKVNKMKKCVGRLLLHFPQGDIWKKNIKIGEFFFKSKFWCGFFSPPILKTVTDTSRDIREELVLNYFLQRIKNTNSFLSSTMNTSSGKPL